MTRIAVDLTPLLPGGENGGAKLLVLELLSQFLRLTDEYDFLLLTADWNHEELAHLEGPQISRLLVLAQDGQPAAETSGAARQVLQPILRHALQRLPPRAAMALRHRAVRVARALPGTLGPAISRLHTQSLLRQHGVSLLFCPFTAPTYAEPTVRVVSVLHDLQHRAYPQFFEPHEVAHRDEVLQQVQFWADAVICVSEHTRRALLDSVGLETGRAWTVHNCIHGRLRQVAPDPEALGRSEIESRPYMFYPANFWPHKNHHVLLTAYGIAVHRNPDNVPDLVFTGAPGEQECQLRRAVDKMGLGARTHFLGYISDGELASAFQHCAFVIIPSLYEGFGIPVLEAFTFSKPVLCSNATSLPEVAGDAALYFDPWRPSEIAHAIHRVTVDGGLVKQLVQAGHRRLAQFGDSRRTAEQYLQVFRNVLAEPQQAGEGLSGVYSDAWTGDRVMILHKSGREPRYLRAVLEAPPHLPHDRLWVVVTDGQGGTETHMLRRGDQMTVTHLLANDNGFIELLFDPTFQPSAQGDSEDTRTLACLWRGSWIVSQDGRETPIESLRPT
jgi:glycosyltransferase involved in cell wall biosynthesis